MYIELVETGPKNNRLFVAYVGRQKEIGRCELDENQVKVLSGNKEILVILGCGLLFNERKIKTFLMSFIFVCFQMG